MKTHFIKDFLIIDKRRIPRSQCGRTEVEIIFQLKKITCGSCKRSYKYAQKEIKKLEKIYSKLL